jgi:hypothetical protein
LRQYSPGYWAQSLATALRILGASASGRETAAVSLCSFVIAYDEAFQDWQEWISAAIPAMLRRGSTMPSRVR